MTLSVFTQYFLPALILGGIGLIFGILIAVCVKVFAVKVDERVEKVTAMLPGYNCGACGCAGCADMADKIVKGDGNPTNCKPIKKEKIEEIVRYLKETIEKEKEDKK